MTLTGEVISKGTTTMNKYAEYTISNTTPKASWFIHDNHLFVLNNTFLEVVLLNSLFDNPVLIESLNCASNSTGATCPDWLDAEYPIDPDLVKPAYDMVLQFFFNSFKLPPNDTSNDVVDNQTA